MKIIHTLWSLGTGGTETMLVDIINEQVNDHEVDLIIINDLIDTDVLSRISKKCHIHYCNRRIGSRNPFPIIKFNLLLYKLNADIIHVHMDNIGKYIFLRRQAKIVRTIHSSLGQGKDYDRYDKLFSISAGVKKYTQEQGYNSEIVYNGIHPELIKQKDSTFLDKENTIRLVNVGRINEIKGQKVLLKAFHHLINKGIRNIELSFIGDGEDRANLEKIATEWSLCNKVVFLGQRSREFIYSHLRDYDIYIQPSLSEGFGLTLVEAMIAGLPIITSDQDGPLEVIDNGKFGLIFKTGDHSDLANCIEKFINGEYTPNTENARRYAQQNFDIKNTARKYCNSYSQLL